MRTRSKISLSSSSIGSGPDCSSNSNSRPKARDGEDASQSQSGNLRRRAMKRSHADTIEGGRNGEDIRSCDFRFSWDEFDSDEDNESSMSMTKILKRDSEGTSLKKKPNSGNANSGPMSVAVKDEVMYSAQCDSDEDQENKNYMQIRMQNMKDNENFLASIGIFKAKEELKQIVTPAKKTANQRGLKMKKEPIEPLPRRKSLRISKLDPSGIPLPETDPDFHTPRSLDSIPFSQLTFHNEEVTVRLPRGPVALKEYVYSKYEEEKASNHVDQFCSFVLNSNNKMKTSAKNDKNDSRSFGNDKIKIFDKMSLAEEHVAKVVPARVFSLDWFPSKEKLMVVAGDKWGHIGFWNVLAEEKAGTEIVTAFKPHVKPVSQLLFSRSHNNKLYSCSYDATLRCLDFEKCVFDDIFSVAEEDDDLLRDFSFVDSNVMVVAHYTGCFTVVDIRTPTRCGENEYQASKKNLHTIHVNPQSSNHFITAGADSTINMWDFRLLNKKSPRPLSILTDHSKTVSSAYFSPSGQQILSCSADDTILVYSVENSTSVKLSKRIRVTGRWLTKFRPTWHPTMDDVFVSGSMARPRRVEIFESTKGSMISCLESDNLNSVCSLNKFHPLKLTTMAGANSSGRLHVFM